MIPALDLMVDPTELGATLSAWLLTYLIHSSLLLTLAWIATSVWRRAGNHGCEAIWRLGLFGGFVTATLAVAAPGDSVLHEFTLRSGSASVTPVESAGPSAPLINPDDIAPLDEEALERLLSEFPQESSTSASDAPAAPHSDLSAATDRLRAAQMVWLPALGVLGVVWALVSVAGATRRLSRRLRARTDVTDPSLLAAVDAIRRTMNLMRPVRLTGCDEIDVPIAFGILQLEICLPLRALTDLSLAENTQVLAHEMAHLSRRDPLWVGAYRLIVSACFFQPLNMLAVRRLRDLAEYECDRLAVECTGEPTAFARCLTEVAGWLVDGAVRANPHSAAMASSMARRGSNLRVRIERLLHLSRVPAPRMPARSRALVCVGFAAAGLVLALLSPRVRAVAGEDLASEPVVAPAQERDNAELGLLESLNDLATEIDALSRDIVFLSQRLHRLELSSDGAAESVEIVSLLSGRLEDLRERRSALLNAALHRLATPTEDSQ